MSVNYLYKYADGTTGYSAFQRGADGLVKTNPNGSIFDEGRMINQDGTPAMGLPSGTASSVMGYGGAVPAPAQAPAQAPWQGGAVFGGTAPASAQNAPAPAPAPVAAPAPAPAASPYASVSSLYSGLLGRAGDQAGIDYWSAKFGDTVDASEQAEFAAAARGEIKGGIGQSYQNNFGRDMDTAGSAYWNAQVDAGSYGSVADLNAAIAGGRRGEDVGAFADQAKYPTAWNSGLSADDQKLRYNADLDKWETAGPSVPAQGTAPGPRYAADLNRQVDAKTSTIEGRINNIMARDAQGNYTNPVIQQAAMQARQSFAGRGLLNSSMSEQAALEAVTSKAIEIAGPDAQTYFSQSRANQDATNVFARDEQNYEYDLAKMAKANGYDLQKMDKGQGYDLEKMAKANGYDLQKMDKAQGYEIDRMDKGQGYDLEKMAKAQGYDLIKIDKSNANDMGKLDKVQDFDMTKLEKTIELERQKLTQQGGQFEKEMQLKYDEINLGTDSRAKATELANKHAMEINKISAVDSAFDLYTRRLAEIDNSPNLDAATKVSMKNSAGANFDLYAKAKGVVYDVTFGGRFSTDEAIAPAAKPTTSPQRGRGLLDSGSSESGG